MVGFLYIHIPFCVRKCIYCDFTSIPFNEQTVSEYSVALCGELKLKKIQAGQLKTVYIGGGTPSLMPGKFFADLFTCLRDNFRFSRSPEITVEANPGTLGYENLELLLSLGINRVSFGAQSFQDCELAALGRIHTSRQAMTAVEMARIAGFQNISLDLIYGIPGQTVESWRQTLEEAVRLHPEHVSAYELTPEKRTPLYRCIQNGELTLPEEGLVVDMYNSAIDFLHSNGYEHYEISNFALPEFRCRHNMNYWDRGQYIAAGAGAHSFLAGVRAANTGNVSAYIERLREGTLPLEESFSVTADEEMRERLFLGLRKADGLPMSRLGPARAPIIYEAADLIQEGYLKVAGGNLRLTKKGMLLSNTVIVTLFEKLGL